MAVSDLRVSARQATLAMTNEWLQLTIEFSEFGFPSCRRRRYRMPRDNTGVFVLLICFETANGVRKRVKQTKLKN